MDEIRISHVSKSYTTLSTDLVIGNAKRPSRTRKVLEDVNLAFPAGQLSVLVGRSGCGKSTLLKMLAGKESPDSGEISLPHGWHAALLSPEPYVITWTNVRQNVAMASGVGKTPEERYEHALEYVRLVGLEDCADLSPVELSTGMKQRLGIAMALLGSGILCRLYPQHPSLCLDTPVLHQQLFSTHLPFAGIRGTANLLSALYPLLTEDV